MEVLAFEYALHSWVDASYILMKRLPEETAYTQWFEDTDGRGHTHHRESIVTKD